jgi:hypothetical protein
MVEPNTIQCSDGGSSPTLALSKTPACRLLTVAETNRQLSAWHYLGPVRGVRISIGHDEGCCVFTNCRSRVLELKNPGIIELARMVGCPNHKWAMTSLMAQAAREVRRRGYTKIVTYADPWAGHTGAVYRAAGYQLLGMTCSDTVYILDGRRIARRTLYDRHGTQSKTEMTRIYGDRLRFEVAPPKHIFLRTL